jgi:SAM-dependent methyltransferase
MISIRDYNRAAWNDQVERGNRWTTPVSSEIINAARRGNWEVLLTETKPVPRDWFPDLNELDVLCLASGGGQQAPILAAAGANVVVFDNSPRQLAQDRLVAERDKLKLTTVEGDMADLSLFSDESFDLIFHPCSNCFAPEVRPVWNESFRALRAGGVLLAGFNNPALYIFDQQLAETNVLQVKHRVPYSDIKSLSEEERRAYTDTGEPLEFGHTLSDQIGGQTDAGFVITGFYEDHHRGHALGSYMPTYIATRAKKLSQPL